MGCPASSYASLYVRGLHRLPPPPYFGAGVEAQGVFLGKSLGVFDISISYPRSLGPSPNRMKLEGVDVLPIPTALLPFIVFSSVPLVSSFPVLLLFWWKRFLTTVL